MKKFLICLLTFAFSLHANAMAKKESEKDRRLIEETLAKADSLPKDPEMPKNFKFSDLGIKLPTKLKKACFVAGTSVLMSAGDVECKSIEDIEVGDLVVSYNQTSGATGGKQVLDVLRLSTDLLLTVVLENGQAIQCTPDHLFYVTSQEAWIRADELEIEDLLATESGLLSVVAKEIQVLDEPLEVFDITVEGTHNYFVVGEGTCTAESHGVLVHNCNEAKEFGKGFVVGASESLPGATQHPPKGSETFEKGRATGEMAGGAAQVIAGTAGVVGGAGEVLATCAGAACAAAPAGIAVAGAGAATAAHGAQKLGEGAQKFFSEGKAHDLQKTHSIEGNKSSNNVKYLMEDMQKNGWKGDGIKI